MALSIPTEKKLYLGGVDLKPPLSPKEALERLQNAKTFEQEREATIARLLLTEEIESLQEQLQTLIEAVYATETVELHKEAPTIHTKMQQISSMINELYENSTDKSSHSSPGCEFTREDQHKLLRILLTPLWNTSMEPKVLNNILNDETVFIGDIIQSTPCIRDYDMQIEIQRVMEEAGVYYLMEKFAIAHNTQNNQSYSRRLLREVFTKFKKELTQSA